MTSVETPATMRQIVIHTLTTDFRKATLIQDVPVPQPGPDEILVKNSHVGINASDVNFAAGRYFSDAKPPFPAGFECMGTIVKAGENSTLKVGQSVVVTKFGAFSEYIVGTATEVIPVPSLDPAFITIAVSGLTASISLEKEGDLKEGKTVLVTAAAGGTGQFAVQIAKQAGCHVIGTCSSPSKIEFLKSIGCDRPVNYKEEDLDAVLAKEYPKGVDVVYECVGKNIFDAAIKNIATFGRVIVIGMISGYQGDRNVEAASEGAASNVPLLILRKSASVRGFFLPHYRQDIPRHAMQLTQAYMGKKLKAGVDLGRDKPFKGLDHVADAIDYMYSGKNMGKVVVEL